MGIFLHDLMVIEIIGKTLIDFIAYWIGLLEADSYTHNHTWWNSGPKKVNWTFIIDFSKAMISLTE